MIAPVGAVSGILSQASVAACIANFGSHESLAQIGFLSMSLLFAMVAGKRSKGPRTSGVLGGGLYRMDGRPDPAATLKGEILSLHPNGRGREVRLSQDQTIRSDTFPKGSTLVFDENGWLREALLLRKQTVQGLPCATKGPVVLEKDRAGITRDRTTSIIFHENGRLKTIGLGEGCIIEEIPLKAGTVVHFREDGRLQNLFLGAAQEIRGLQLPRWTSIDFHENGVIASLHFINPPKSIKGLPGFSGSFIAFDENGQVRRG
jgi:hypothetical protein